MASSDYSTPNGACSPLTFELINLDQHPDGKLLRLLAHGASLREREWVERLPPAKHLGKDKRRDYNKLCHDMWKLDGEIAKHPATTRFGAHAKALYALDHKDFETKAPTYGGAAVIFSALSDALRIGALS